MGKILLFALFVLLVIVVVRWQGEQYQAFMGCAGKVSGKLTKKEENTARPSTGNGRVEYVVSYSYVVDGKEYNATDTVEFKELWLDLKEGQDLEVYYSKKDPAKSYPVIVMDRRLGGKPAVFGDNC